MTKKSTSRTDLKLCKHQWTTKYSSRLNVDGVEWYCRNCHSTLPWPEVKRRVNAYEAAKTDKKYVIVRHENQADLEELVSLHFLNGYILAGPLVANEYYGFVQSMIKEESTF